MTKIVHHPLIPPPSAEAILAEAERRKCPPEEAGKWLFRMRWDVIRKEEEDPFRFGWEPPIWKVADALLGFSWWRGTGFERLLQRRFGMDWDTWAQRMRVRLGFELPVTMLLILGANRSSKSEYSGKRGNMQMQAVDDANVYAFHMSNPRSVRDQQPLFWKYMPAELRKQQMSESTYIKYKRKTGFAEGSFICPNGSECTFLNYSQERDTALEGLEANLMLPDELVPPDWLETMVYRLATRAGRGVVTFTPVNGYTASVKLFCDGAKVTLWSVAHMLPKDGGEPDEAAALGLTEWGLREAWDAEAAGRAAKVPQSQPEDCLAWVLDQPGDDRSQADMGGRTFELVPRVMRPVNRRLGVLFFHSRDNPYGNPKQVMALARGKGPGEIRMRVYGLATKTISAVFPKFRPAVHVVPAAAIPAGGTNYMFMDPAHDRNFFMLWVRRMASGASYVYREWPGAYPIPDVGVPDPWAMPSGRKNGYNDGARGDGQKSFGWGLMRYKFELARLEGWVDWKRWRDEGGGQREEGGGWRGERMPGDEELWEWEDGRAEDGEMKAGELIEQRFVDSRAASDPRVENDRPVTLYEDLCAMGLNFVLAPGVGITDGVARINQDLDFDEDMEGSFFNAPKLFVSDACPNLIFAMENWMNADGGDGATKDPIDCLRYFFTAETPFVEARPQRRRLGGFFYGRGSSGRRMAGLPGPRSVGRRAMR